MRFYHDLYVGEDAKKHRKKIIWKLKHRAGQVNVYVIALADGRDLLEIYHCGLLQQGYYKRKNPFIVGIARGYEEAVALVETIVAEVYEKTGGMDVKGYLLQNKGRGEVS